MQQKFTVKLFGASDHPDDITHIAAFAARLGNCRAGRKHEKKNVNGTKAPISNKKYIKELRKLQVDLCKLQAGEARRIARHRCL